MIENDGKILLVKQMYGFRTWTFPGGGVKKGETAIDAVRREVKEEVGLDLENIQEMEEFESTAEYKRDRVKVFRARAKDEALQIDSAEIKEARWFGVEELPPLARNATKTFLIWKERGK